MEGALRYTLFTLFPLFRSLTLFILSKLLYTAQTVACMPMYLYCICIWYKGGVERWWNRLMSNEQNVG